MTQAADYIATLVEQLKSIAQPAGLTAPLPILLPWRKEEAQVESRKD